jgi:hypothetical protein
MDGERIDSFGPAKANPGNPSGHVVKSNDSSMGRLHPKL